MNGKGHMKFTRHDFCARCFCGGSVQDRIFIKQAITSALGTGCNVLLDCPAGFEQTKCHLISKQSLELRSLRRICNSFSKSTQGLIAIMQDLKRFGQEKQLKIESNILLKTRSV